MPWSAMVPLRMTLSPGSCIGPGDVDIFADDADARRVDEDLIRRSPWHNLGIRR